jgi:hypothetical protein
MAAFLSRSVDGILRRGSRKAAMGRFWRPNNNGILGETIVGPNPQSVVSDGEDIWVSNLGGDSVSRVHASSGKLLETWTGATAPLGVLSWKGRIFATGVLAPGKLYMINPALSAGAVTTVATNLGTSPNGIAADPIRIWTANQGPPGSVSIITPKTSLPWTVTTVTIGSSPFGAVYDGSNVWISDWGSGQLLKLNSVGAVLQTVTVGSQPAMPVFDGTNIWVPNFESESVSVVRASTGAVLATLTGLSGAWAAAFDGQYVAVTSLPNDTITVFKAADLSLVQSSFLLGSNPAGICSDGIQFWVAFSGASEIARY